jgi:hypothetical protein
MMTQAADGQPHEAKINKLDGLITRAFSVSHNP